jgi:hypothetical protein
MSIEVFNKLPGFIADIDYEKVFNWEILLFTWWFY